MPFHELMVKYGGDMAAAWAAAGGVVASAPAPPSPQESEATAAAASLPSAPAAPRPPLPPHLRAAAAADDERPVDQPHRRVDGGDTQPQVVVLARGQARVEAARALAQRQLEETHADDTARLHHAFLTVTARPPAEEEIRTLLATLKRERQHYQADPAAAENFLAIGETSRNTRLPAPEHAAWTQVATLLLNLSETLTKR